MPSRAIKVCIRTRPTSHFAQDELFVDDRAMVRRRVYVMTLFAHQLQQLFLLFLLFLLFCFLVVVTHLRRKEIPLVPELCCSTNLVQISQHTYKSHGCVYLSHALLLPNRPLP